MNQGDRAWHYSPGPKGVIRRVALVVGLHDSTDGRERVNLAVFGADHPEDDIKRHGAVPVRYDYIEGGPVDAAFCAPLIEVPKFQGVPLPPNNVPPGTGTARLRVAKHASTR